MKKNKDLKQFFENRNVLFSIAAACAVGIILTIVLFSLAVFDSVNMMSSINVKSKNTIAYDVKLTPDADAFFPKDTLGSGENYLLRFTDRIIVRNSVEAHLSKGVETLEYSYSMIKTFVVRSVGNGNPIVLSRPETINLLADPSAIWETHESDYVEITPKNAFEISLKKYQDDFSDFKDAAKGNFSGELAIEFRLTLNDDNNINTTITRGIVIPITSETYRINFTGQDVRDQNFPEREVKLPALPVTILVILILISLIWGLNVSLKKAFYEKDEYKRALKTIFKKSIDGIIKTDPKATIPDYPTIDVKDFKELAKTSQSLNRPIVCFEMAKYTIFYVVCDDLLYKFKLTNKSDG